MYRAELEEVMMSGKKKKKAPTDEDNTLMTIAAVVNKSAYWSALYSDFTANKNTLAEHLPVIANAMQCIANAPSPFERLSSVSPALAALAKLETGIGEDLASSFRAHLTKLARESVQAAERSLSVQGSEAATLAKRLENGVVLARVIDECVMALPALRPRVHESKVAVSLMIAEMQAQSAGHGFSAVLKSASMKEEVVMADIAHLREPLDVCFSQLDGDQDDQDNKLYELQADVDIVLDKVMVAAASEKDIGNAHSFAEMLV